MSYVLRVWVKYLYHQGFDKFGKSVSKGEIDFHRNIGDVLTRLLHGDESDSLKTAWSFNLSRKRFKDRFGEAVSNDESFVNDTWEWTRLTDRNGIEEEVMCNPEDVNKNAFMPT